MVFQGNLESTKVNYHGENGASSVIQPKITGKNGFHDVKRPQNGEFVRSGRAKTGFSSTSQASFEETPLIVAVITYIGYGVLVFFGYLRDFMRLYGIEKPKKAKEKGNKVDRPTVS